MIAATQIIARYCLILPAFKAEFFATGIFPHYLSTPDFILLVLTTLFIAAGGYIINDYFDIHIDEINKPDQNIVGKILSKKTAKSLFFILSGTGIIVGFYLAIKADVLVMGMVPLFSAISLWMYSSFYKRRLFIGNIIVAILCSLSVLIVGLFEPEFYRNITYLLWFGILSFLLTLVREMIKDIEDMDGDELSQCKTAPIVLGIKMTKWIITFLIFLTIVYIAFILANNFYENTVINIWFLMGIFFIPLGGLLYLVLTATEKKDYYYASLFSKIIITAGIFTMLPFWYYFLK